MNLNKNKANTFPSRLRSVFGATILAGAALSACSVEGDAVQSSEPGIYCELVSAGKTDLANEYTTNIQVTTLGGVSLTDILWKYDDATYNIQALRKSSDGGLFNNTVRIYQTDEPMLGASVWGLEMADNGTENWMYVDCVSRDTTLFV